MQKLREEVLGDIFQETIQLGDEIKYYNPLSVTRDPRVLRNGYMTAVCPSTFLKLIVRNGGLLYKDTNAKQVTTVGGRDIVNHVNSCY